MKKNKISVIVPACNAESTIEGSVGSIIGQDYDNIECIIVENNSADRTYEICAALAASEPSVKLFRSIGKGVSAARNLGLKKADGDIIGFCDADDYLESGVLAEVNREFENNNDLDCIIGALYREANGQKTYFGLSKRIISHREAMERMLCDNRVMGSVCNKYYKKEALKDVFFDEELSHCEDTHFNISAISRMGFGSILLTNTAFYVYRYNPDSATNRFERLFNENNELRYIQAINKIMETDGLNREVIAHASMAKAALALDYLKVCKEDKSKSEKLYAELKNNFKYLVRYSCKYGLKIGVKRILLGLWYFLRNPFGGNGC